MNTFHPDTIKRVAHYVRRMLAVVKHTKSERELGYALAAARIVVEVLQEYPMPFDVAAAGEKMREEVMTLVRWRR
jgi:hypothetical protein